MPASWSEMVDLVREKTHAYMKRPRGKVAKKGEKSEWRKEGERRKRQMIAAVHKLGLLADEEVLKVAKWLPGAGLKYSRRLHDKTIVFTHGKKEYVVTKLNTSARPYGIDWFCFTEFYDQIDALKTNPDFLLAEHTSWLPYQGQKYETRTAFTSGPTLTVGPEHVFMASYGLEAARLALFRSEELWRLPLELKKKIWDIVFNVCLSS